MAGNMKVLSSSNWSGGILKSNLKMKASVKAQASKKASAKMYGT
jgi:hypothetical protein